MKFRVPKLNRENFREEVTSKERTKYVKKKRKYKAQLSSSRGRNKFQNDSANFSNVDTITANFAASNITTRR
jgi:hypothetical protein